MTSRYLAVAAIIACHVTDPRFNCHIRLQVDLTRLCWFKPDFVMDVEHSDEDLVALFAQLSETGKWSVAGTLNPGMFRSNPSHTSLSSPSRSLRARLNYAELYTAEDVTRIVQKYRDDFTALGYSPRIDCV